MAGHSQTQGLIQELMMNAEVPPRTVITSANQDRLLTRQSLEFVSKLVGQRLGRKLAGDEFRLMIAYFNKVSPIKYYKMTYRKSITVMAGDFLAYYQKQQVDPDKDRVLGDQYQYKEMEYLYDDENMMKFSAFPKLWDYRQDNEKKDARRRDLASSAPPPSKDALGKSLIAMSETIQEFTSPTKIADIMAHLRSMNTTYQSISAPRETLVLDSRNRNVPNSSTYSISWNINMSDNNGRVGDVRVKFPIQQVIRMTCYPFWMWLASSAAGQGVQFNPYGLLTTNTPPKVRIFIEEMPAQNVQISVPRGINNELEIINYHFEADIVNSTGDVMNNQVLVQPNNYYTMQRPLSEIDTLTLSFYRDTYQIPIYPDNYTFSRIQKIGNIVILSGMTGANALTYKRILYANDPNYASLPVVYPIGISNLVNLSLLLYKTLVHISNLVTIYPDVNALLNDPNGLSMAISIAAFGDNLTLNDDLAIDVSTTSLAALGDFDIDIEYTVYFDAFAFTIPIEFICLEMPPN